MHRRCIALFLGIAILLGTVPVKIRHGGLAEETFTQSGEPAEAIIQESTAEPTVEPLPEPTEATAPEPTVEPTVEPTAEPTHESTVAQAAEPSSEPPQEPLPTSSPEPTEDVTPEPTVEQTPEITIPPEPTAEQTPEATITPEPTAEQTPEATITPEPAAEQTPEATITPEPTPPPVYYCGMEEHTHDELCFSSANELICELPQHAHSEACLVKAAPTPSPSVEPSSEPYETVIAETETPAPFVGTCGFEEHVHADFCFDENAQLTCGLDEHMHTSACFSEEEPLSTPEPSQPPRYNCGIEEHEHTESCYTDDPTPTPQPVYYCGSMEHEHADACLYPACSISLTALPDAIVPAEQTVISVQVSGGKAPYAISLTASSDGGLLSQETGVLDTEGTWEWIYQPTLTGMHQLAATVTDANGTAVSAECVITVAEPIPEVKEDWTESFAHLVFSGDLRTDLLAIAQTQLGYTESETDIIYVDGQPKGYTRYGAWFDAPYEDWCAMFVSFCLHYANIDEAFPLSGNVPDWIEALTAIGAYRTASDYLPMPGDLIFFDWDGDGSGDHTGLVAEASASEDEILLALKTIEGNVDHQVAYRQYTLPEDTRIMGFGQIADNEVMERIQSVEALIAPIPPVEEVEEIMISLSGTDEEIAYLMQIAELCLTAWQAYEPLGAAQQSYVRNAHLLLDLEWLWSMHTLEEPTGGTSANPVARNDDLQTVGSSSGIRFRLFNYDASINSNGHKDVFGFRGANLHDPEGDDTVINTSLDADGYGANRARVKPLLSNGYPVFDGRGITGDFSLGYLFGTGGTGITSYSPSNTPLLRSSSTNLYRYDSARNAVDFDIANNRFIVRNYVERGDSTAGFGSGYADFMPFTYWNNTTSYTNSSGVEYYYDSDKELDYWFGMTMDTTFFQPKNGHIGQDEMVFSFSGDDDVWVFIDDVLVLDLGGTHGVVTGSINFATGEIIQHLDWAGASTPSYPTTLRECFANAGREPAGGWSENGNTFADYSKHTFKFFYLERGAGSSNCKLTFNLPTLPDESLTVTKELSTDGIDAGTGSFIQNSLHYAFRVMKADTDGSVSDELFIQPGTSYTLLQDGAPIDSGTVLDDGTFLLKSGQSAQFSEMIAKGGGAVRYVVQEIMPDELTGQYGSVEYEVSGDGGETKTEEGPSEAFTAFETAVLSAEESQIVTYRNKVATSNLSSLKLSKKQAPGSVFSADQVFRLQVRLGSDLLPAGTAYAIEGTDESRTVDADGVIELKIGETVNILKGILSGTEYSIAELDAEEGGFHAVFSGTVTQNGTETPLAFPGEKADGSFPLNSEVHVTATNASYDFAIELPLSKQAVGNQENESFVFLIEQGSWNNGIWTTEQELPGTAITVTDASVTNGKIVIGFSAGDAGTFYYKISEQAGESGFLYDDTFYIVQVTVENRQAAVTAIWKNGSDPVDAGSALSFLNLKTVPITVDKTVTGLSPVPSGEMFDFILRVEEGGTFAFPESTAYEIIDDSSIRFSLAHGQSIAIPHVPVGATITISETGNEGYIASYRIDGQPDAVIGSTVTLNDIEAPVSISFINRGGYMLPSTGGSGTHWYTAGGLGLLGLALLLYISKRRWQEGG